jgi:hypothetical protein
VAGIPAINPSPGFRASVVLVSLLPGIYLAMRGDPSADYTTVLVAWLAIVGSSLVIDRHHRRQRATERLFVIGESVQGKVVRTKEIKGDETHDLEVTYEYVAGGTHRGKFRTPWRDDVAQPEVGDAIDLLRDPDEPAVHAALVAQPSLARPLTAPQEPTAAAEPSGHGRLLGVAFGFLVSVAIGVIAGLTAGAAAFQAVTTLEVGLAIIVLFGGGAIALVVRWLRPDGDRDMIPDGAAQRGSRISDVAGLVPFAMIGVFAGTFVLSVVGEATGWLPRVDCNKTPDACQGGGGDGG